MDLNGQFVGWRHDYDLGRSQRRINSRKEGQQISQCFTGTRLRSQIRVLPGSERRNCGDLNGAGVGYLLLRERSYEFRWHRQIGKLHEIELATVATNTFLSRGMVAGRAVILTVLPVSPVGVVMRRRSYVAPHNVKIRTPIARSHPCVTKRPHFFVGFEGPAPL